jgi:hypothetical protein
VTLEKNYTMLRKSLRMLFIMSVALKSSSTKIILNLRSEHTKMEPFEEETVGTQGMPVCHFKHTPQFANKKQVVTFHIP